MGRLAIWLDMDGENEPAGDDEGTAFDFHFGPLKAIQIEVRISYQPLLDEKSRCYCSDCIDNGRKSLCGGQMRTIADEYLAACRGFQSSLMEDMSSNKDASLRICTDLADGVLGFVSDTTDIPGRHGSITFHLPIVGF